MHIDSVNVNCTECFNSFQVKPGSACKSWKCDKCKPYENITITRKENQFEKYLFRFLLIGGMIVSACFVGPIAYESGGILLALLMFFLCIIPSTLAFYLAFLPIGVSLWIFWWAFISQHKENTLY